MKNYVTTKTLDFRLKMRKLGRQLTEKTKDFDWDIISEHKDMILKGVFWGISVSALLLSLYNVKAGHDMKNAAKNSAITSSAEAVLDNEDMVDSLFYKLQSSLESSISSKLDEYITSYIAENGSSNFFTADTISLISKEVENDIISHLKETSTINASQEAIIREIIAEKIAEIDYSDIEEKIAASVRQLGSATNSDLTDLGEELSREIAAKVGNAIANISSGIAGELSPKDYMAGDYVTVDGKLYECIENVTVTEENRTTVIEKYFKEASLTTALANLSSELNTTINNLSESTNTSIANLTESVDASLTNLSESMTAEMERRTSELSEKINSSYNELSGNISDNYNKLTESAAKNYSELKSFTDSNADSIEDLAVYVKNNADAIVTLNNFTTNNADAIATLQTLVGNNADAIAALNTLANGNSEAIAALNTLINGNTEAIAALNALTSSHSDAIASLNTSTNNNSGAISSLNGQLTAGNSTSFQFGYENNAYGYYVGGTFYPF